MLPICRAIDTNIFPLSYFLLSAKDVVMLSRLLLVLVVISAVIAVVGCEGDAGPAGATGPAGPAGAAGVIAWGEVNGFDPGGFNATWPAGVTATITKNGTGVWTVDLTGTFPSPTGGVVVSSNGGSARVSLDAFIDSWSTTAISIDFVAWSTDTNNNIDDTFTYIVLEDD